MIILMNNYERNLWDEIISSIVVSSRVSWLIFLDSGSSPPEHNDHLYHWDFIILTALSYFNAEKYIIFYEDFDKGPFV